MDTYKSNESDAAKQPANDSYEYNESNVRARASGHERLKERPRPIAIPANNGESVSALESVLTVLYRIGEILLAVIVLLVSLPVMLIIAVFIRIDSPGPVFFRMERTGKSRRVPGSELLDNNSVRPPAEGFKQDRCYCVPTTFPFVKFRTMYVDAAKRFPEYYWWNYDLSQQEVQNMYYKVQDDPRLTRVGQWLRKTSLDELPNFWHILTGEAALVGPRPEGGKIQGFYTEQQMRKFTVKPGLTCLSKIYGRGDLPVGEQIKWDLEYADKRNVWLDIKIVFSTIWLVLTQRGAF